MREDPAARQAFYEHATLLLRIAEDALSGTDIGTENVRKAHLALHSLAGTAAFMKSDTVAKTAKTAEKMSENVDLTRSDERHRQEIIDNITQCRTVLSKLQ